MGNHGGRGKDTWGSRFDFFLDFKTFWAILRAFWAARVLDFGFLRRHVNQGRSNQVLFWAWRASEN